MGAGNGKVPIVVSRMEYTVPPHCLDQSVAIPELPDVASCWQPPERPDLLGCRSPNASPAPHTPVDAVSKAPFPSGEVVVRAVRDVVEWPAIFSPSVDESVAQWECDLEEHVQQQFDRDNDLVCTVDVG